MGKWGKSCQLLKRWIEHCVKFWVYKELPDYVWCWPLQEKQEGSIVKQKSTVWFIFH